MECCHNLWDPNFTFIGTRIYGQSPFAKRLSEQQSHIEIIFGRFFLGGIEIETKAMLCVIF